MVAAEEAGEGGGPASSSVSDIADVCNENGEVFFEEGLEAGDGVLGVGFGELPPPCSGGEPDVGLILMNIQA